MADENKSNMTKTDVIRKVLGYGESFDFLIGVDENNNEIIKTFHITPVPLRELPELEDLVNKFFEENNQLAVDIGDTENIVNPKSWTDTMLQTSAEILYRSLRKMHPDMTAEKCLDMFTLGILSKAIDLVMDINDFFMGMEKMVKKRMTIEPTQKET